MPNTFLAGMIVICDLEVICQIDELCTIRLGAWGPFMRLQHMRPPRLCLTHYPVSGPPFTTVPARSSLTRIRNSNVRAGVNANLGSSRRMLADNHNSVQPHHAFAGLVLVSAMGCWKEEKAVMCIPIRLLTHSVTGHCILGCNCSQGRLRRVLASARLVAIERSNPSMIFVDV